jgi:hypothetical protein
MKSAIFDTIIWFGLDPEFETLGPIHQGVVLGLLNEDGRKYTHDDPPDCADIEDGLCAYISVHSHEVKPDDVAAMLREAYILATREHADALSRILDACTLTDADRSQIEQMRDTVAILGNASKHHPLIDATAHKSGDD